jgi:hypothetical protein
MKPGPATSQALKYVLSRLIFSKMPSAIFLGGILNAFDIINAAFAE